MVRKLCGPWSNICSIVIIQICVILGFWVGDHWNSWFSFSLKPCDVSNSSIVRKIIQKRWNPVLQKYGASLPLECPMNLSRDMLGGRESLKKSRSSYWQCRKCGKKFYLESHLDQHIQRRHSHVVDYSEDSICLGEYCDVMRCDVFRNNPWIDDESKSTDVSIWSPLSNADKSLAINSPSSPNMGGKGNIQQQRQYQNVPGDKDGTKTSSKYPSFSTASPYYTNKEGKGDKNQGSQDTSSAGEEKETCDEKYFSQLKGKCKDLVWQCIQGLIAELDVQQFQNLHKELEKSSCSYLSCSKYCEDCDHNHTHAHGKLRPFLIVFGSLSFSFCLALAYYFTWIYTQSGDDGTVCLDPRIYGQPPEAMIKETRMLPSHRFPDDPRTHLSSPYGPAYTDVGIAPRSSMSMPQAYRSTPSRHRSSPPLIHRTSHI